MASKVFLDANIILDLLLQRSGYQTAEAIVQKGMEGEIQLYTTPSVLHITAHWITKAYKAPIAKQLLLSLLNYVTVIDSDHDTAIIALNSSFDDIEDSLQYYVALKHKMNYFVSADKKLKKNSTPQLPILSAPDLLTEI